MFYTYFGFCIDISKQFVLGFKNTLHFFILV